jgi:hypothetical protein
MTPTDDGDRWRTTHTVTRARRMTTRITTAIKTATAAVGGGGGEKPTNQLSDRKKGWVKSNRTRRETRRRTVVCPRPGRGGVL